MRVVLLSFLPLVACLCPVEHILTDPSNRRLSASENEERKRTCGWHRDLPWPDRFPPRQETARKARNIGVPALDNEVPSAVYFANSNGVCTGVLITDRHVLTARHCVYFDDLKSDTEEVFEKANTNGSYELDFSYFAEHVHIRIDPSPSLGISEYRRHYIEKVSVVHNHYYNNTLIGWGGSDFAILTLNETVKYPGFACIETGDFKTGLYLTAGYGHNITGQATYKADGERQLNVVHNMKNSTEKLDSEELGSYISTERVIRSGDSGGGLLIKRPDGKQSVVGIVSWNGHITSFHVRIKNYARVICVFTGACDSFEFESDPLDMVDMLTFSRTADKGRWISRAEHVNYTDECGEKETTLQPTSTTSTLRPKCGRNGGRK